MVGARPQFVKLAAISKAVKSFEVEHLIVNTGQHYDANMSDIFFDELQIPNPDINLNIGSSTHGVQTGEMMAALDPVFLNLNPDWVLVYGDTNSTIAATLSAIKLHCKVAHLEAGLRSFNRQMPEEHNRVLSDHASDLLLAPTTIAMSNLRKEGLESRSVLIGDVMTDICFETRDYLLQKKKTEPKPSRFILATIHRAENTDNEITLRTIINNLKNSIIPIKLLAHPRLIAKSIEFGISLEGGSIEVFAPVSYQEMIGLIVDSHAVVTDSGGLQKEAFLLNKLCITIRSETEWVETLIDGWNVLDPLAQNLNKNLMREKPKNNPAQYYGSGNAAALAISEMLNFNSGTN